MKSNIEEWLRTFAEMLSHTNDIPIKRIFQAIDETSEIMEFDPRQSNMQTPHVDDTSNPAPSKRVRATYEQDGNVFLDPVAPPPTPHPPSPSNTSDNQKKVDSEKWTEDDAVAFVQKKVDAGKWILEKATAFRASFSSKHYARAAANYTYEFVVNGTDKDVYDNKDIIVKAGFDHYSKTTHSGWNAFVLKSGRNAMGRFLSKTDK